MHNQYCSALHLSGQFETLPALSLDYGTFISASPPLCVSWQKKLYPPSNTPVTSWANKKNEGLFGEKAELHGTSTVALPRHLVSRDSWASKGGIRLSSSSKQWSNHSEGWINKFSQLGYTRIKIGGIILSPLIPHSVFSESYSRQILKKSPSLLMISLLKKVNNQRSVNTFFFWLLLEIATSLRNFILKRCDYNFFNHVTECICSFATLNSSQQMFHCTAILQDLFEQFTHPKHITSFPI